MKRSQYINLDKMRKKKPSLPLLRPLTLAIASITLAACSNHKEEAKVVSSVQDCTANTSLTIEQCQVAYKKAEEEAARTAPRYNSRSQCEEDFGYHQCVPSQSSNTFMPLLTGFLIGNALSNNGGYASNPVYRYRNPSSSYRDSIVTGSGSIIGKPGQRSYRVDESALKPTPRAKAARTMSRGGFGSIASAKSSWGGGKSRGWGG